MLHPQSSPAAASMSVLACAILAACGDHARDPPARAPLCGTAAEIVECACPNGTIGGRPCGEDASLGACECDSGIAGSAGASASQGGTRGTAGATSGAGGTSGGAPAATTYIPCAEACTGVTPVCNKMKGVCESFDDWKSPPGTIPPDPPSSGGTPDDTVVIQGIERVYLGDTDLGRGCERRRLEALRPRHRRLRVDAVFRIPLPAGRRREDLCRRAGRSGRDRQLVRKEHRPHHPRVVDRSFRALLGGPHERGRYERVGCPRPGTFERLRHTGGRVASRARARGRLWVHGRSVGGPVVLYVESLLERFRGPRWIPGCEYVCRTGHRSSGAPPQCGRIRNEARGSQRTRSGSSGSRTHGRHPRDPDRRARVRRGRGAHDVRSRGVREPVHVLGLRLPAERDQASC
jgi:hypothetical protein